MRRRRAAGSRPGPGNTLFPAAPFPVPRIRRNFAPFSAGGVMRHIGRFLSGRETPSAGDYILALAAVGGLMLVTIMEMLI
jgi:hypothetical protein